MQTKKRYNLIGLLLSRHAIEIKTEFHINENLTYTTFKTALQKRFYAKKNIN